jgi:DNA polymerase III subunit epsilon
MMRHERQDLTLEEIARRLTATGDYKVLRRLLPWPVSPPQAGSCEKTGVVIDVETTGLNHSQDEIIELAMVKFRYAANAEIAGVSAVFQAFNEPSRPIAPEITRLTGITEVTVGGHKIDPVAVEAFVAEADIVIAHHANFDRRFVERVWPIFEHKAWACSATEIDWKALGYSGAKLSYLATETGFFYTAHRAVDDCHALLEILSLRLPGSSTTALTVLLDRACRNTVRIWAEHSPFDRKDTLKRRGYRWSDGTDGSARSWYIDIDDALHQAELDFLRKEIYQRDVDLPCSEMSALERFSVRQGRALSASHGWLTQETEEQP